eukprot:TRINITY_DN6611_c0_g1_i1.p1 TRINITY_DN6611_c0_g1~~TRINITY_DN6611_c0_g1_i1.p1  ORF type:complete len:447 (+),score=6.52 TRINITY_DN6611_c0_g1_i1:66-1343(+)
MSPLMLIGDDVWGIIGLYASYAPLCRVCTRLHALLWNQHLAARISSANVLDLVKHLDGVAEMVRSLALTAPGDSQQSIREAHSLLFAQLLLSKNLQALSLRLRWQGANAAWAKSLANIQVLSSLEFIDLRWSDNNVGPVGFGHLARLLQGPQLKGFCLDVARNSITETGVEQWVSLVPSASLTSLRLTLSHNRLGQAGAHLLQACLACHTLRILDLSLDNCSIPPLCPTAQEQLCPSQLTTLSVNLARNPLTDVDMLAQQLPSLTPDLRNLTLVLYGTRVSTPGAQTLLTHVIYLLHLECLSLDFSDTNVQEAITAPLSELTHSRGLKKLSLALGSERHPIGDAGAIALARLAEAPLLKSLDLHLSLCHFGDRGAMALASLAGRPCLQKLYCRLADDMYQTEAADKTFAGIELQRRSKDIFVGFV